MVIDDFRKLSLFKGGKAKHKKAKQDKGYRAELRAFLHALKEEKFSPVPLDEVVRTTLVTFKVLESLATGRQVELHESISRRD